MPTLQVSYWGAIAEGVAGAPISSETVTTSGSTAKTANGAPAGAKLAVVWGDANHWVAVGPQSTVSATGGATAGVFVPANTERHILLLQPGRRVAAITA